MARNGALDILKIFLALMVIGIHAGFLTDVSDLAAYLTSNGLFRIAVPVFLLINGYFFYQIASAGMSLKWLKRALVLYALWMAIYLPYWLPDFHQNFTSFILKSTHAIFFGYYHLWYLAGILGAAMVMATMAKASTKLLITAMAATFLGGVAIQYAGSYHLLGNSYLSKILSLSWPHRNFIFFSFPFFCAGYLINKHKLQDYFTIPSIVVLAGLGTALMLLESYLNFIGTSSGVALDNLVSLAIVCPAIFILFMKMNVKTNYKELSLYATGIYLIHVLIILVAQNLLTISPTALTALTVALAMVASYFLILLHRRFPFIL